ncbi:MAG: S8 family peptidase [Polyangiaceae bacterium]
MRIPKIVPWKVAALMATVVLATSAEARAESVPDDGPRFLPDATLPLAATPSDGVEGEIVVDLRNDTTDADVADLSREYGIDLRPNSVFSGAERIERAVVASPSAVASLLARLRGDRRVEHAEPMAMLGAYFVPDDPLYATKQWHLTRVGAETAWNFGCGQGVTVAVIDTGVACYDKGPFMRGTDLGGTRCVPGYNFVDDSEDAYDDQGHGTHVAGTIAQTTHNAKGVAGLAYCARLMPVKVLTKSGWGTVADVAEGVRFAADHGADVINLSLGSPVASSVLEDAIRHALDKGVTVVAAAGNTGRGVGYPAAYPDVLAVSATDANDKIAWFSSRGREVSLAAPGVSVTQQTVCDGGKNKCELFGTFQGTSMAAPHVAGVAAMVVGMGVTGRTAVRDVLLGTARPKEGAELYGAGIVDASTAVLHVFWRKLALRFVVLALVAAWVRRRITRRGGEFAIGTGEVAAALVAGTGLLPFLPLFGLAPRLGTSRLTLDLLARPFGEWDLAIGTGLHGWLPFASALPVVLGTVLFFGVKRLRPTLGAFAVGASAYLFALAVAGGVATPLGDFGTRVFAVANALVCVWIARIALDTKRA